MSVRVHAFLSGFWKNLLVSGVLISFVWIVASSIWSSPAFMIVGPFIMAILSSGLGLLVALIFVPIVLATVFIIIDRSSLELLGALAVYPVLIAIFFGFRFVEKERVQSEVEFARSSLNPRYLERTIDNPVGRIKTLALLGKDWCTTSICPLALADGMAERVAILGPPPDIEDNFYERNPLKSETLWVEKTFRAAQGEACFSPDNRSDVFWAQQVGLFGTCIIGDDKQFVLADAILILDSSDGYQFRPHGLKGYSVSAAYEVKGNTVHEIARWEMGALSWSGPRVGETFEKIEFLRALTGTTPNRVAEAAKLTLPQRIDLAYAGIGKARIDVSAVVTYLGDAPRQVPEGHNPQPGSNGRGIGGEKIQLDDEYATKLRAIAEEACTLPPSKRTKRFGYAKGCVREFNSFVDRLFSPATASALKLPTSA